MLVQRSDVGEFRRRYRWLVLVAIAAFGILIGRLAQLQIVEGDLHRAQARRNIVRERSLATTRGVIRDAFGRVLAANRPSYSVHITPAEIDLETTWPRVMKVVQLDEFERAAIEKRIADIKALPKEDKRRGQQILLKVDVDRDVVAFLETHEKELKASRSRRLPVRYYPYGELGAHAVGYMREVDAEALERLDERGYRAGDRIGAIGIERRWESYLRGQRGWRKMVRGIARRESNAEIDAQIPGRAASPRADPGARHLAHDGHRSGGIDREGHSRPARGRGGRGRRAHRAAARGAVQAELRSERRLRRQRHEGRGRGVSASELRSAEAHDGQDHLGRVPAGLDVQAVHARWPPWPIA